MCFMKVQRIQQQNYSLLKTTPKTSLYNSNINFEALALNKKAVSSKKNSSLILKMGAMATAAAMSVKELFFNKVLDVSTVNQIKQNAIHFGEGVAESIYLNDGKFNQQEIEQLVLTHLKEEDAKNLQVATDEDGFCDFAEQYMKLDREYAKSVFEKAEGLVAQSASGKMMFLLKLEDKEPEIAAHIAAHEFEHLLYKTSGFVGKLIKKYLADQSKQQSMEASLEPAAEGLNKKFFKLQNGLVGLIIGTGAITSPFEYVEQEPTLEGILELSPEVSSKEELDMRLERYIKREFLQSETDDSNMAELQGFEMVLRDEARAYEAGGKSQKYYNKLSGKNVGKTTMAEMVAVIYNQMADKIRECKNQWMKSSLKKSMGLKD